MHDSQASGPFTPVYPLPRVNEAVCLPYLDDIGAIGGRHEVEVQVVLRRKLERLLRHLETPHRHVILRSTRHACVRGREHGWGPPHAHSP